MLFDERTFGIQIISVDRPILDARISHTSILTDIYLNTSCMETRCSILRRTTPLDIVSFGIFFEDDESMFELSSCFHIHTKICLQWIRYFHPFRNIEKSPPAPDCAMQGGKHMITIRNTLHEVFPNYIFILMECDGHIFEYHSLLDQLLPKLMINYFTIILSAYSREHLSFCFRDSESIKCLLDRIRNIIPRL